MKQIFVPLNNHTIIDFKYLFAIYLYIDFPSRVWTNFWFHVISLPSIIISFLKSSFRFKYNNLERDFEYLFRKDKYISFFQTIKRQSLKIFIVHKEDSRPNLLPSEPNEINLFWKQANVIHQHTFSSTLFYGPSVRIEG